MEATDYVTIDLNSLNNDTLLPFNLYLLNPASKITCLFLNAHCELDTDLKLYLNALLQKGAVLSIAKSQLQSYLDFTNIEKEIVLSSTAGNIHRLDEKRNKKSEQAIKSDQNFQHLFGEFSFGSALVEGAKNDDYSYLYQKAYNEIMQFSLHYSQTVSLAIYLSEQLMKTDNFINRVVATAYFLAKGMRVINQAELSDIIVASYLHHIGNTHFPLEINAMSQKDYDEKQIKEWKMHPKYALKFIDKLELNISPRCKSIIEFHHRKEDGLGFPDWEGDMHVDPFAEIVGLSSYLWEYAMGKIDGNRRSIKDAISDFKLKKTESNIDKEYCQPLKSFIYAIDLSEKFEKLTEIHTDDVYSKRKVGNGND